MDNCVLYDRICIDCGECDLCDLDNQKRCTDCGACIEDDNSTEYRSINVNEYIKTKYKNEENKK